MRKIVPLTIITQAGYKQDKSFSIQKWRKLIEFTPHAVSKFCTVDDPPFN